MVRQNEVVLDLQTLLFDQPQPIAKDKIHSTDQQRHTTHYGISERGAEGYHNNPDTYLSTGSKGALMFFGKEEVHETRKCATGNKYITYDITDWRRK